MASERGRRAGFTLIELLVVISIIALLIAILLPSLNDARRQSRATLCATRIGQLTRSILIYAEDYEETPPFLGSGYENIQSASDLATVRDGKTALEWAELEDWIVPHMPDCWLVEQVDWPEDSRVRNGSMFPYTRYEELYRCPEFERVTDSRKSQSAFNYTRAITCRRALSSMFVGDDVEDDIAPGPIVKMSTAHSPSALWMLLDEQWDYNCAAPLQNLGNGPGFPGSAIVSFWQGAESIHCICGDMLGSYHGPIGREIPWEGIQAARMGSVSHYDGHVTLVRDPLPYRNVNPFAPGADEWLLPTAEKLFGIMLRLLYAQRGLNTSIEEIVEVFG